MPLTTPKISVVIKAIKPSTCLGITLQALRRQSIAGDTEIIVLTRTKQLLATYSEELTTLQGVKIIQVESGMNEGAYKAAGIRSASAPYVMFLEDHSFPAPDCLENILRTHESGDYAVVGPLVLNGNPCNSVSWGCYLVFYGQWGYLSTTETEHLPANNSCYAVKALSLSNKNLAEKLKAESVFHWELIARGCKLKHTETASVFHLNTTRLRLLLKEYFLSSRIFAANRFGPGKFAARLLYTGGSPLLPLLRTARIFKVARQARVPLQWLLSAQPTIMLCLCAGAFGEMLGYSLGAGSADHRLSELMADPDKLIQPTDVNSVLPS